MKFRRSRLLRTWTIVCCSIGATAAGLATEVSSTPAPQFDRRKVTEAIELSGGADALGEVGKAVSGVYVRAIRSQRPDIPEHVLLEIGASVEAYVSERAQSGEIEEQLVTIYEHHLTPDDIRQITAFFSTDAGRHYRAAIPEITKESTMLGKQWAESLTPGIKAEIAKHLK